MGKKILVVDNEEVIVEMIQIYLQSLGYNVIPAYGGSEAMSIIGGDDNFDLILLDIMMPQISGWEVLDFIENDPDLSSIPVIIITAKINEPSNDERLKLSPNIKGYILKPFEMDTLEAEICKIF